MTFIIWKQVCMKILFDLDILSFWSVWWTLTASFICLRWLSW